MSDTMVSARSGIKAKAVDVHQHSIPAPYRAALEQAGLLDPIPGVDYPTWGVEKALDLMDRRGIATAMLSITEPGVGFVDGAAAHRLARTVNEFHADLIRDHPHRFGAFAVLPLPDLDASLEELRYASEVLKLDGVALMTNIRGVYVGDPSLEPLLAEIERRSLPAFIHPSAPATVDDMGLGLPVSLYEFTFDTTRMVAQLMYSGALDRHPDLRLIVCHAGGALPYLAKRLTYGPTIKAALAGGPPADAIASLRRLYYDTAMSASAYALPSLRALIEPAHILLGTDFPFMPESTTIETLEGLETFSGFTGVERADILRGNALELFPRLRTPAAPRP
ncbi:MAG: amidohydrolase family protein [Candidatus Dormibacteraceae bacterium]